MANSKAGSSSGREYQVFLSFRGPDTRTGFTNVLFHSLTDAGISVFLDDEELRVGERIDGSLLRAIDNSRIYIPIFSRTYAASKWCLQELVQIVANTLRSEGNKEILPIFFDVEPDDVKMKTPLYRDVISNLEREKMLSNEQVDAWRKALVEVDAIKGWEMKKYKGYRELIKLVVEEVLKKLKSKHRLVTDCLVGIDDRAVEVSKLLDVNSGGVRLIKIYGMGGIGKTTIANVVFNQLSSHFGKCCCFLEDVRSKSSRVDGFIELQRKLLNEISIPAGVMSIDGLDYGMKRIGEALRNQKVFIVLDDVDNSEQVEKLIGNDTLYSGSRILITTRNKDVLRIHGLDYQIFDYEMEEMSTDHALELFCRHAFNKDSPSDDYYDLSREIIDATGRLPLALEVIGSLLYHKAQKLWKETLDKLTKAPHKDVFEKLKISYDALCFEQQQIFLDIACFFIGEDMTNPIYMWEDCKFYPHTGVDVLISMSLIKIMKKNRFWMHDQLRDFGREIVHGENPTNPRERSRLWINDEVFDAIRTKEINKNVQALYLGTCAASAHDAIVQSEEIRRFELLRYFRLSDGTFAGDLLNCFTKLRWISWKDSLRTYEWTNMYLENIVVLEFSKVDLLDDSRFAIMMKVTRKLKVLNICFCDNITRTPNFLGCTNLERLTFEKCAKLREIDRSIGKLKCLTHLKIGFCECLEDLPEEEIGGLVSLKYFNVTGYELKKLPNSILKLKSLREVHFSNYSDKVDSANSWELSSAIGMLQDLEVLIVVCRYLKGQLPYEIGSLLFLTVLDLSTTLVSEVPKTISMLPRLQKLVLTGCHKIQELPALPASLTHLRLSSESLRVVPNLSNLINLVELKLSDGGRRDDEFCTGDLWWVGRLSKLTKLSLELRNVPAPADLASLPLLNQLDLIGLDIQTFPELPWSLQKLELDGLNSTASLSPNLINLSCLELRGSSMQEILLDGLQLPHLRELRVERCVLLDRVQLSSMRKLKDIHVKLCPKLIEIELSGEFEVLDSLCIEECECLGRLVYGAEAGDNNNECANELVSCEGRLTLPSRALKKLQLFHLSGCHKIREIEVVGALEALEFFTMICCPHVQRIGGLSNLKNLEYFAIHSNDGLRVVEGLDELESLDFLTVDTCESLERLIDLSSTKLPDACHISYSSSSRKLCGVTKSFDDSLQSLKHYKEEQEAKQRRRLGRVSFLLKVGVATATCLSALFLSKSLAVNKKNK